jgi:hypothetical protein
VRACFGSLTSQRWRCRWSWGPRQQSHSASRADIIVPETEREVSERRRFVLESGRGYAEERQVKDLIMPLNISPSLFFPIVPCDTDTPIPEFIKLQEIHQEQLLLQSHHELFRLGLAKLIQ